MTLFNKVYVSYTWFYTVKKIKNRIIYIPCEELKAKQRYFLNAIKWVYPYKTDTLISAKIHAGKKWILKMDIKDFYNSVPYNQIQNVINRVCQRLNQNENALFYLLLVTLDGKLPTGAPTSAHIANACLKPLDNEILRICSLYGIDYTRYVDDLTFSAYSKEALNTIEQRVKAILKQNNYEVNHKKTKYISSNKQQNILGLVVNDYKVRLPKDFKRTIRAMLHGYVIRNLDYLPTDSKYLAVCSENQLVGYISYVKHVDYAYYKKLKIYSKKLQQKYFVDIPFFK